MGSVDQSFEISEHITLKSGLAITKHAIHIPFIDRHEITDKKSLNCANLIKECTPSNNGITAFNHNEVSTLCIVAKKNEHIMHTYS